MVYVRKTNRKIRSNKGRPRKPYRKRSLNKKLRKRKQSKLNRMDAPKPNPDTQVKSNKSDNLVEIMTPRKQIVKLPRSYPGDMWVHQYLIEDNNIPLKFYQKYQDNLLNDTYMKYWNICYNKY